MDGPESELHHHHHTGTRWLDVLLAGSAILISAISLFLAVQHGHAMEKMVEENSKMVKASTWPFVTIADSNGDEQGNKLYKMVILNNGVGPARVHTIDLFYKGQPVADMFALTKAVAADAGIAKPGVAVSNTGGVIPARQSVAILTVQQPTSSPELIAAFSGPARAKIDVSVCYCSIFDECWTVDTRSADGQPRDVKACPLPKKAV